MGGCGNMVFNIIIITEAEGYKGSKVFEVMAEGYKSVTYSDWLCFFKGIVYKSFGLSVLSFLVHLWRLLLVSVLSPYSRSVSLISCSRASMREAKNLGGGRRHTSFLRGSLLGLYAFQALAVQSVCESGWDLSSSQCGMQIWMLHHQHRHWPCCEPLWKLIFGKMSSELAFAS